MLLKKRNNTLHHKIAIFGSCVSRDAFTISDKIHDNFLLVGYFARSSFASLACKPYIDENILRFIDSPFQRRMVKWDMEKGFIRFLKNVEFDILLIDFIDERFGLQEISAGAFVTRSNEFLSGAKSPLPGRRIGFGSREHIDLWKKGLISILEILQKIDCINCVRINEVYWANVTNSGTDIKGFPADKIHFANKFLQDRYADLKLLIPQECFISYPEKLLVADEDHKWGISPFHYVPRFYQHTIDLLTNQSSTSKHSPSIISPIRTKNILQMPLIQRRLQKIETKNEADHGLSILAQGKWAPPGFEAVTLEGLIFDQNEEAQGRTYLWWVHQMSFLPPLIAHDRVYGRQTGCNLACTLVSAWFDRFCKQVDFTTPAWHDHATALRARNLLLLREHLSNSSDNSCAIHQLNTLLILHGSTLAKDDFYNAGNNHGLDQSLVLFEIASEAAWPDHRQQWRTTALIRIKNEVNHAFASDGGHIENSPAYQNYGIQQLVMICDVLAAYGFNPEEYLPPKVLEKSLRALTYLVKPNGKLPLIGDTYDFTVTDMVRNLHPTGYDAFLYAIRKGNQGAPPRELDLILNNSGWAVLRNTWCAKPYYNDGLHLTLKAGCISSFHRHDDDLQIELYAFGEDWVIDAGLYKHLNTDPYRIFVRSPEAHSIPMPFSVRASRNVALIGPLTKIYSYTTTLEAVTIKAQSGMFPGFLTRRLVNLNRKTCTIRIFDRCEPVERSSEGRILERLVNHYPTYLSRFVVPADKCVSVIARENKVLVGGKSKTLAITCKNSAVNIKVQTGVKKPRLAGWVSIHRGKIVPATAIEFHFDGRSMEALFHLTWEPQNG